MLNATLARILHANGTEHLRGQIARRIKTLGLFLKVNPLQLKRVDALNSFVIGLARDPAESFMRAAIGKYDVVIIARDARDERNCRGKIFNFSRHRKRRIDQDRHGQLMASTVINHSALGGQRNRPLLLMSCLLYEFAIAENLQINQASANSHAP